MILFCIPCDHKNSLKFNGYNIFVSIYPTGKDEIWLRDTPNKEPDAITSYLDWLNNFKDTIALGHTWISSKNIHVYSVILCLVCIESFIISSSKSKLESNILLAVKSNSKLISIKFL